MIKTQPAQKKKTWWKWAVSGCLVLIILSIIFIAGCWYLVKKGTSNKQIETAQKTETPLPDNFSDQLDLMMLLEDNFKLEEVIISQDNEDLLVRCKAPTIKGKALNNGLVQVFAFINQRIPGDIKTIKLIFTINHVDATIVEVQRKAIDRWMNNEISNTEFINKFNAVSLIK